MKKKKYIALLIALTLITASVMPAAVFADTISKEAKACKDLGILIGKDVSTGVTAEYLAETPTRIQALIIFLRISGLDDEALTYDWDENFDDAKNYDWVVGRNYLGYAKENPDLGWIGSTDGRFYPTNTIDSKAFYKVMLESLGYNQGIDFEYDETLTFAQSVGLFSNAKTIESLKSFTIDHVAKAIYATLNTSPKDETKSLITLMTEKGIIDESKATKAGFKIEVNEVKVKSFERLSNNRFVITLDEEIPIDKDDISITPENGKKEISIDSIEISGDKIYITTAFMTAFEAYNLSINMSAPVDGMAVKKYNKRFVALPRDTKKPKATAEILSNTIIQITFDEEVDKASAEDTGNYIIQNDLEVFEAQLDYTGKVVTLITAPQREGWFYRLKIADVTDLSGNTMEAFEKSYEAQPKDMSKPTIDTIQVESNRELTIIFTKSLNRITAERTENYTIANNAIRVEEAILDETGKAVKLITTAQNPDTQYRITVRNIADLTDNVMYEVSRSFKGSAGGSARFDAYPTVISNSEVDVRFGRKVEKESAEDISNYEIDNGLDVLEAYLTEDKDGDVVTLITSNQTFGTKYLLEISNIYDRFGSALSYAKGYFIGVSKDTSPLNYAVRSGENKIILTFNKRIEKESAENEFNYILDSSLGYAATATLDQTGKVVTLLTKAHENGKVYTIKVENITDLTGTTIKSSDKTSKRTFVGYGEKSQKTLRLDAISAFDMSSIDLYFDNPITDDELKNLEVTIITESGETYKKPEGLDYQKYFSADKATVRLQFKTDASKTPEIFRSGKRYEVRVSNIDRLEEDSYSNIKSFPGTSKANEPPYIVDVYALNSTAIEVSFSKPVKGISANQFSISGVTISSTSVAQDEATSVAMLYLSNTTQLKDSTEYKLTVKSGVKDAAGYSTIPSNKSTVEFTGTSDKNEPPEVDNIQALNKYTLAVEFSEPIVLPASSGFTIKRIPSGGSTISVSDTVLSGDKQTVTVYLNSANGSISADYEYEVTISTNIKDLQGLSVDSSSRKIELEGSDVELPQFEILTGAVSSDNKTITLITSNPIKNTSLSMDCFEISGANYGKSSSDRISVRDRTITITLRNELKTNSELTIKLTNSGKSTIKDLNNQKISGEELELSTY